MFIYKITVNKKIYIGFDSKDKKLNNRWDLHKRECESGKIDNKLYRAMRRYGIDNCKYEVIEEGFDRIQDLALAEIDYIAKFDSYRNGLNSTPGGDGLGKHDLAQMTNEEIYHIKKSLSDAMREYNINVKWANTTPEERRELTKTWWDRPTEVRSQKTKEYWDTVGHDKREFQLRGLKSRWKDIPFEERSKINRKNGLKGAKKVSKKVKVEFADGRTEIFPSKSEFVRQYDNSINYIIKKTKQGLSHKGKRAWEI